MQNTFSINVSRLFTLRQPNTSHILVDYKHFKSLPITNINLNHLTPYLKKLSATLRETVQVRVQRQITVQIRQLSLCLSRK